MRTLKLRDWFQELNDREKSNLKEKFIREFQVTDVAFYRALRNDNISVQRALFFAKFFNIQIEDLFSHPLEVKIREKDEKEKKTISRISNDYGLVTP